MVKKIVFPKINYIVFAVSFVVAFAIYFFSTHQNGDSLLRTFGFLPVDEPYTELFLNNHLDLPPMLPEDTIATASFTIHNVEHTKKNYKFIITETLEQDTSIIGSGAATLAQNQSKSFAFTYSVATTEPKTKIQIALPEQKQEIHFWVNNK